MQVDRTLILAAANLARSAPPEAWSAFLGEFEKLADQKARQCVKSPAEILQVAQGRAQEARGLFELLRDCKVAADKIGESRK